MTTYLVKWRYYSSLCERHSLGRLEAGDTVDVDPVVAAAINADSPGVLVAKGSAKAAPEAEPEHGTIEPLPADRMLRKPGRKRAADG